MSSHQPPPLPEVIELELAAQDEKQLLGVTATRSDVQQNPTETRSSLNGSAALLCCSVSGLALITTIISFAGHPMEPATTCTVRGGETRWPLFHSAEALAANDGWSSYMRGVYGDGANVAFPLCIGEFWMFYKNELATHDLPLQLRGCPAASGEEGQYYQVNSRLQPANVSWSWHAQASYGKGFANGSVVEVLHQGGLSDEHVGAWFLYARGSGIWLSIGRTVVFETHEQAYERFNVSGLPHEQRNEARESDCRHKHCACWGALLNLLTFCSIPEPPFCSCCERARCRTRLAPVHAAHVPADVRPLHERIRRAAILQSRDSCNRSERRLPVREQRWPLRAAPHGLVRRGSVHVQQQSGPLPPL